MNSLLIMAALLTGQADDAPMQKDLPRQKVVDRLTRECAEREYAAVCLFGQADEFLKHEAEKRLLQTLAMVAEKAKRQGEDQKEIEKKLIRILRDLDPHSAIVGFLRVGVLP